LVSFTPDLGARTGYSIKISPPPRRGRAVRPPRLDRSYHGKNYIKLPPFSARYYAGSGTVLGEFFSNFCLDRSNPKVWGSPPIWGSRVALCVPASDGPRSEHSIRPHAIDVLVRVRHTLIFRPENKFSDIFFQTFFCPPQADFFQNDLLMRWFSF